MDALREIWQEQHSGWVSPKEDHRTWREGRAGSTVTIGLAAAVRWLPPASRVRAALSRGFADPEVASLIYCDPRVQGGTPIFRGTRIPVYLTLELLSDVTSFARTLREYPELGRQHLIAALRFAAAALSL